MICDPAEILKSIPIKEHKTPTIVSSFIVKYHQYILTLFLNNLKYVLRNDELTINKTNRYQIVTSGRKMFSFYFATHKPNIILTIGQI